MLDSPYTESLLVTANYSTPENEGSQRNVSRECRHVALIARRPHARATAECATQVYWHFCAQAGAVVVLFILAAVLQQVAAPSLRQLQRGPSRAAADALVG